MKLLKYIKSIFRPNYKQYKNYTVYRIANKMPTVILQNFKDLEGFHIPKETECLLMPFNDCQINLPNIKIMNSPFLDFDYDSLLLKSVDGKKSITR